jgi:hypothetical protein
VIKNAKNVLLVAEIFVPLQPQKWLLRWLYAIKPLK